MATNLRHRDVPTVALRFGFFRREWESCPNLQRSRISCLVSGSHSINFKSRMRDYDVRRALRHIIIQCRATGLEHSVREDLVVDRAVDAHASVCVENDLQNCLWLIIHSGLTSGIDRQSPGELDRITGSDTD